MAKNDELGELAARYADLLGGATRADDDFIETVRALDTLYAVEAPVILTSPMSRVTSQLETGSHVEALSPPPRREADSMHVIRTMRGRRWTGIMASAAACLVVGLLAALLIGGRGGQPGRSGIGGSTFTQQGGLRITASTACANLSCTLTPVFGTESSILSHRFADVLGVHDATITQVGATGMTIELPGVTDMRAVVPLLFGGNLEFLDTGATYLAPGTQLGTLSTQYSVAFRGTQVDPASVSFATDPQTGQKVVTFAFTGSAQDAFARYTAEHIGQYLTIALDASVVESAVIQSGFSGTVQLTGLSLAQTRLVEATLKYGPLPAPIRIVQVSLVSPGGAIACGSGTPPPTVYPSNTPTPPPDATPEPPTPTPWPNPTPIPTGTQPPTPSPIAGGDQFIQIVSGCGTATPGPVGLATPTAPAPSVPGNLATPTPRPSGR